MAVDVLEYLLQQVETALHAGQDGMRYLALFVLLQFLLYVGQYEPDQLDDGYDQGSKSQGTRVKAGGERRAVEGREKFLTNIYK